MPQARFIEVLDDYQKLRAAYTDLRAEVKKIPQAAHLAMMYGDIPSEAVARETEHFRLTARRNERAADAARRKRQGQFSGHSGMEPRRQFASLGAKLTAKNLQPQFNPDAFVPVVYETYAEAKATGFFSPEELFAQFPDEAPPPPSTDVPESLYKIED
jgi:hypothetical protein